MSAIRALENLRSELDALHGRIAINDECMEALARLYSLIWIQACYDSDSASVETFARELLPYIQLLNKHIKFKP